MVGRSGTVVRHHTVPAGLVVHNCVVPTDGYASGLVDHGLLLGSPCPDTCGVVCVASTAWGDGFNGGAPLYVVYERTAGPGHYWGMVSASIDVTDDQLDPWSTPRPIRIVTPSRLRSWWVQTINTYWELFEVGGVPLLFFRPAWVGGAAAGAPAYRLHSMPFGIPTAQVASHGGRAKRTRPHPYVAQVGPVWPGGMTQKDVLRDARVRSQASRLGHLYKTNDGSLPVTTVIETCITVKNTVFVHVQTADGPPLLTLEANHWALNNNALEKAAFAPHEARMLQEAFNQVGDDGLHMGVLASSSTQSPETASVIAQFRKMDHREDPSVTLCNFVGETNRAGGWTWRNELQRPFSAFVQALTRHFPKAEVPTLADNTIYTSHHQAARELDMAPSVLIGLAYSEAYTEFSLDFCDDSQVLQDLIHAKPHYDEQLQRSYANGRLNQLHRSLVEVHNLERETSQAVGYSLASLRFLHKKLTEAQARLNAALSTNCDWSVMNDLPPHCREMHVQDEQQALSLIRHRYNTGQTQGSLESFRDRDVTVSNIRP